ncbi:hypothetical protein GOBAR_AA22316 [Gossypium barbadense]|uniref:Uncharacterized protein n=1 Tax=Gossypium barbadense TaxID=3634 RepID=A0A2P5X4Y1_GOSBA|nr:hypothetical protein GOBAR_AA22316 [Gossypium barbadense]
MEENVDEEENFIIDVTYLSDSDGELFESMTSIQKYNRIDNDGQRNKRKLKTNGGDDTGNLEDDDFESNSDLDDDLCSNGFDLDQVYSENSNSDAHLKTEDEPSVRKNKFPLYDPNIRVPKFPIGMIFLRKTQFKEILTKYAITTREE